MKTFWSTVNKFIRFEYQLFLLIAFADFNLFLTHRDLTYLSVIFFFCYNFRGLLCFIHVPSRTVHHLINNSGILSNSDAGTWSFSLFGRREYGNSPLSFISLFALLFQLLSLYFSYLDRIVECWICWKARSPASEVYSGVQDRWCLNVFLLAEIIAWISDRKLLSPEENRLSEDKKWDKVEKREKRMDESKKAKKKNERVVSVFNGALDNPAVRLFWDPLQYNFHKICRKNLLIVYMWKFMHAIVFFFDCWLRSSLRYSR